MTKHKGQIPPVLKEKMENVFCFDIESCDGGKPGSLCSLGFVLAKDLKITKKQDFLVNPACNFNPFLTRGKNFRLQYPKSVYRASPDFRFYYPKIKELLENNTVFGFSVTNDVKYLNDACMYYGLDFIDYEFFDVQTFLSIHLNDRKCYSLKDAADLYGIEFFEHSSADDAEASFKVLCGILEKEGLTLSQFIKNYSVKPGRNVKGIIYPCTSPHPATALVTDSKSAKSKLNAEFLRSLKRQKGGFNGKRFCFSEELEFLSEFRSIVSALYKKGGTYTPVAQECNVFVEGESQSKRLTVAKTRDKKRLSYQEFLSVLGEFKQIKFDDEKVLLEEKARKQQERIDEFLSQRQSFVH